MGVRVLLADGESAGQALKRLRKRLERHGALWELRRRTYYLKPAHARRAKRFRKRFKARLATFLAQKAGEQTAASLAEAARKFWRRTGKP
jgi:ribosomal protein S21